jgi:hypothetical protein
MEVVIRSAVQEYFPVLEPQVDINIDHPACWNKEGKLRSLSSFGPRGPDLVQKHT